MATMYSFGERMGVGITNCNECISLATGVQMKSSKMRKILQYIYFEFWDFGNFMSIVFIILN